MQRLLPLALLAIVGACAQQEEAAVTPEPVYDKHGNIVLRDDTCGEGTHPEISETGWPVCVPDE